MLSKGQGVVIFTGAAAGTRPFANSAAFGPANFGMRGLAQVMLRDPGPQGLYVREHGWRYRHALHSPRRFFAWECP
jgi:NADP-dependent 3-hydroxy acid dehydrogenase YdfG